MNAVAATAQNIKNNKNKNHNSNSVNARARPTHLSPKVSPEISRIVPRAHESVHRFG